MLQEGFFRPAGVIGHMAAEFFPDFCLFGAGLSKNGIDNLGHLPAQGTEIRLGPTQLLGGGRFFTPGTEFQHLGVR